MDIQIVDTWRNVRIAPTKAVTKDSDAFAVCRDLVRSVAHAAENGQARFSADQEFYALLKSQQSDTNKLGLAWEMPDPPAATLDGMPIFVWGDPLPANPGPVAAPAAGSSSPSPEPQGLHSDEDDGA